MTPRARLVVLRVVLIALATAGVMVLAGGRDAFWLCLPMVLLAAASCRTRLGAALSAVAVTASAAAPAFVSIQLRPLPAPPLALLVPTASVAVLIAVRERLERVAAALKRSIRGQDTVARIGRDEFCVLAPETDLPGAQRLEARIARAVGDVTAGVEALRASSGVALFPGDGVSPTSLLHAADQGLLSAKRDLQRGRTRRRAA